MSLAGRAARIGLGVAGAFIGYAWLPHLFTGTATWRGPVRNRAVALTFDDGPDPRWTPRVLDVLAAHGARATFFLIGRRAAAAPDVVRAIADAGHEVANHTWSHPSLWLCSPRRTEHEIARGHVTLAELTGVAPRHFRPPWGMVNAAMGRALTRTGERCVFWSLQPEGLRPRSAEAQAEYVVTRVSPGAIVDLHDAEGVAGAPARLVAALGTMLDGLRDAGYRLTTVAELLGDARAARGRE
ncbi:MAG: polysaccharide deacetylase family protein [Candidatus Rokuibacteriota bacterium]|nr:MAG: polysaccharide deacetylase family protein [Candidatus Rokubacteria bacterium]